MQTARGTEYSPAMSLESAESSIPHSAKDEQRKPDEGLITEPNTGIRFRSVGVEANFQTFFREKENSLGSLRPVPWQVLEEFKIQVSEHGSGRDVFCYGSNQVIIPLAIYL